MLRLGGVNRGILEADMSGLGGMAPHPDVKPDASLKIIKYNYPDRGGCG